MAGKLLKANDFQPEPPDTESSSFQADAIPCMNERSSHE